MADTNGTKASSAKKVQKIAEPSKVLKLNFDNCRKDNIFSMVKEHSALEILSLINTNLSSLKGFPKLTNLKKLCLSANRISDGLNNLASSPKLQYLDLSGNKIKDFEVLEALQDFKQLTTLDLFNNEVTKVENYREKLFKMLPSLKFLDGRNVTNTAAPSDDDKLNSNDSDEEEFVDSDDLGEYDDDEDDDDDDDDDDSGEEEDMSLAEIYNEDLEEDNSDWEEGEGGDDDDDEIESDDENDAAVAAPAKGGNKKPADEPTAKKRKTE